MGITYRSNINLRAEFVKQDMPRIMRELDKALLLEAGQLKADIKQGAGPNGPLGSYSKSWAEVRKEAGRQTGHVDLWFSGQLMKAILTRAAAIVGTKIKATMYINRARQRAPYETGKDTPDNVEIARHLIAQGKDFFGLGNKAERRLLTAIRKAIGNK